MSCFRSAYPSIKESLQDKFVQEFVVIPDDCYSYVNQIEAEKHLAETETAFAQLHARYAKVKSVMENQRKVVGLELPRWCTGHPLNKLHDPRISRSLNPNDATCSNQLILNLTSRI